MSIQSRYSNIICYFDPNSEIAAKSYAEISKAYPMIGQIHWSTLDIKPSKPSDNKQLVITLGGDGMMLRALHEFVNDNVDVYGVNLGSLKLSPTHSVWLINYSFCLNSSNSTTTSNCRINVSNTSGTHPTVLCVTNFINRAFLNTWHTACQVVSVGSTTSTDNFILQNTITADGSVPYVQMTYYATRIA